MFISTNASSCQRLFLALNVSLRLMDRKLVGVAEAAQMAGVSRATFWKWRAFYENFPKPIEELASGPVWEAETMAAWIKQHQEARKALKRKKKPKRQR
jgi:predicted DNA-binding transcriptional regulator AlpA